MTDRINSISSRTPFTDQLHRKSRLRRHRQERAGRASTIRPRETISSRPLELSSIRITDLRPSPRKLRTPRSRSCAAGCSAISALGFCVPLIVGRDNEIIDGEVSFEAAKQLGLDPLPCVRVGHLSPEEQRVVRLAVNRLGKKADGISTLLKIEFEELIVADAPIEITGFSPPEIDQIILGDGADGLEQGPLEPEPSARARSQSGRCISTRRPHRVVCGDATDARYLRLHYG